MRQQPAEKAYGIEVIARILAERVDPAPSQSTLRYMARKGAIPTFKIGRRHFARATDVARFVGCAVEDLP